MKRSTISLIALTIAILITGYFVYLWIGVANISTSISTDGSSIEVPEGDTSFENIFYSYHINDSLPHYEYRSIEDSINRIKQGKDLDNKGVGSYKYFGSIGLGVIRESWVRNKQQGLYRDSLIIHSLDSLNKLYSNLPNNNPRDSLQRVKEAQSIESRLRAMTSEVNERVNAQNEQLYYLTLSGYSIDPNNEFFVQNGNYYLAVAKWDSTFKRTHGSMQHGHYERKQIPIRYSPESERILIPISQKKYNFLNTLFTIVTWSWLFVMVLIFLGLPVQILIDISKGKAFTKANIKRFKVMSLAASIYIIFKIGIPYILNFIFRKSIPDEFELKVLGDDGSGITVLFFLILATVSLFLIGKAFQKGYNLQQEQDLTI